MDRDRDVRSAREIGLGVFGSNGASVLHRRARADVTAGRDVTEAGQARAGRAADARSNTTGKSTRQRPGAASKAHSNTEYRAAAHSGAANKGLLMTSQRRFHWPCYCMRFNSLGLVS